jgi:tetratricopeptide (TPR) repeat protein
MTGAWDKAAEYWRKSLDLSTKLTEEYPNQSRYTQGLAVDLANWAQICVYQGNFADARKSAEESLDQSHHWRKVYPENAYIPGLIVGDTYLLSAIAEALGDHAEAVKRAKEADQALAEACRQLCKDRGPSFAAGFCGDVATELRYIGQAWQRRGKQREAAIIHGARTNVYREVVRLKPDDAQAHHNLGDALQRIGQLGEAIAEYREAIRLKPDYAEV